MFLGKWTFQYKLEPVSVKFIVADISEGTEAILGHTFLEQAGHRILQ